MRGLIAIFKREVVSFFVSPIAYFVITGFALLCGYFFFNLLGMYNSVLQRYAQMAAFGANSGQPGPNLNQWVAEPYYQTLLVILVFLIPLLTMRTIAEEKKRGTFELLITSPVSVVSIVLGKFLGVAFVLFLMLAVAFVFPYLLVVFGNPGPEVLPLLSGWLAVFLCALGFASISMAISAFTENQIVAGVSGIVILLILYVINAPAETAGGVVGQVLEYLSPVLQSADLFRGVLETKTLVYFASMIMLGIFLSIRAIEGQRWR